jgi:hypothetical protein
MEAGGGGSISGSSKGSASTVVDSIKNNAISTLWRFRILLIMNYLIIMLQKYVNHKTLPY